MKKHILTLILSLPVCVLVSAAAEQPASIPWTPGDLSSHTITGGRLVEQTFDGASYRTVRYNFDGLGRPYQRIAEKASPAGSDVVDFIVYDCMGRPDSVAYLPYTKAGTPTWAGSPDAQRAFYRAQLDDKLDAGYAFGVRVYDRSPLGLLTSSSAPGSATHAAAGGVPVRYSYRLNALPQKIAVTPGTEFTGTTLPDGTLPGGGAVLPGGSVTFPGQGVIAQTLDSVKRFTVTDQGAVRFEGWYALNTLSAVITEQRTMQMMSVQTIDYTDSRGNKVACKVTAGGDVRWSYNVYDEVGRLRCEIPPIMDSRFNVPGKTLSPTALNPSCTCREYDGRGNCILTRNPGQAPVYVVYDAFDRPILTQNGSQRTHDQWTYTKYDDYGRPLETRLLIGSEPVGEVRTWFADIAGFDAHRKMLAAFTTRAVLSRAVYGGYDDYDLVSGTRLEEQEWDGTLPDGLPDGFAPGTFPTDGVPVLPAARRKVYRRFTIPSALAFRPVAGVVAQEDLHDDPTGLKIYERLAILPDVLTDTTAYVEKASYYDREGRMVQSVVRNHLGGVSRLSFRYDFTGNLLMQHEWRQAGPDAVPDVKITRNTYDSNDRLTASRTRLNDGPETSMQYSYDERDLVSSTVCGDSVLCDTFRHDVMGRLTVQDNPFFMMALQRDKPLRPEARPNYTGQISECRWLHKGLSPAPQTYTYYYDARGQFTTAFHYEGERRTDRFTENGISYDLNGNITALKRSNATRPGNELNYHYSGNQLVVLTDNDMIVNSYIYDPNGNVASESQSGWKYAYNCLNLTERVSDKRMNTVAAYRYLADGTKLGVADAAGNGYEYLGSLIYRRTGERLELESTDFAGGRIIHTSAGYAPLYFVRDYLGSVRAVVNERGQRLEANDYYPFGGRWNDPQRFVTDNRYLFNGKEWQPTGGLNVLDYGARHYDPTLGRWFNPDPAMQFINPYTFCGNDPINYVDPDGMSRRIIYDNKNMIITVQATYYHDMLNGDYARLGVNFINSFKNYTYTDKNGNIYRVVFDLNTQRVNNPIERAKADPAGNYFYVVNGLGMNREGGTILGKAGKNYIFIIWDKRYNKFIIGHEMGHTLGAANRGADGANRHSKSGLMVAIASDPKASPHFDQDNINDIIEKGDGPVEGKDPDNPKPDKERITVEYHL